MPMNSVTRITPSQASTMRAFFASGGLNAGTPSDTASTPVRAVHPWANARRRKNVVTACAPAGTRSGGGGSSQPKSQRTYPYPSMPRKLAMKR